MTERIIFSLHLQILQTNKPRPPASVTPNLNVKAETLEDDRFFYFLNVSSVSVKRILRAFPGERI